MGRISGRYTLTSTGLSPTLAPLSNGPRPHMHFLTAPTAGRRMEKTLPQPHNRNPCRVSHDHGLASSDFARHYSRNHNCFLFLRVLRCFTSPRSPLTPYFIQMQVTAHNCGWVPPFGHPRINARLPTPQGLSQAPTSFIGSRCQGIHHAPCPACPHKHPTPHNNTSPTRTASKQARTLTRHTPDTTQNPATSTITPATGTNNSICSKTQTHRRHIQSTTHQPPTDLYRSLSRVVMLASTIQESNNKKPTSAYPSPGRRA